MVSTKEIGSNDLDNQWYGTVSYRDGLPYKVHVFVVDAYDYDIQEELKRQFGESYPKLKRKSKRRGHFILEVEESEILL